VTDPSFNLLQLQSRPNWYDHLSQVEAAMAEQSRIDRARSDAGWEGDEGGWYSPCGMHEFDWELEGYPFPEDPEYGDWFRAHYHHTALEKGVELNPYPRAPASRSHLYLPCANQQASA